MRKAKLTSIAESQINVGAVRSKEEPHSLSESQLRASFVWLIILRRWILLRRRLRGSDSSDISHGRILVQSARFAKTRIAGGSRDREALKEHGVIGYLVQEVTGPSMKGGWTRGLPKLEDGLEPGLFEFDRLGGG